MAKSKGIGLLSLSHEKFDFFDNFFKTSISLLASISAFKAHKTTKNSPKWTLFNLKISLLDWHIDARGIRASQVRTSDLFVRGTPSPKPPQNPKNMRFSTLSPTDPFPSKPSKLASVRGVIGSVEAILSFHACLGIPSTLTPQKDATAISTAPILMKVRRFQKLLQYDRYRLLSAYPTLPTCRPNFSFFQNFKDILGKDSPPVSIFCKGGHFMNKEFVNSEV